MKLVPRPQQFWKSWDEVPETVPEEFMHVKFFVEIFAGKAGLSRGVRRRRKLAVLPPIEIEISEEVQYKADILDPAIRSKLEAWIRAGVVQCVHVIGNGATGCAHTDDTAFPSPSLSIRIFDT